MRRDERLRLERFYRQAVCSLVSAIRANLILAMTRMVTLASKFEKVPIWGKHTQHTTVSANCCKWKEATCTLWMV